MNEALRDVSLSLGNRTDGIGNQFTWLHFVCKHIQVKRGENGLEIVHEGNNNSRGKQDFRKRKQANFNWIRSGYVLRESPSNPKSVTLFCFGATESLLDKVKSLANFELDRAIDDPYILLQMVMEDLCWFVDERVWMVGEVFGDIEEVSNRRKERNNSELNTIRKPLRIRKMIIEERRETTSTSQASIASPNTSFTFRKRPELPPTMWRNCNCFIK